MPDAPIVTSPTRSDSDAADRERARRLVAAWLAGTATPPDDGLRVEALGAGNGDENTLCFCSGTFCWPPVDPTGGQKPRADLD